MTLTLDIPPELETQLREASARVGQAPEAYVIAALAVVVEESTVVPGPRRIGSADNISLEEFDAALDELEKIGAGIALGPMM